MNLKSKYVFFFFFLLLLVSLDCKIQANKKTIKNVLSFGEMCDVRIYKIMS